MKPVFTSESLGLLQNYPLWMKVELTKQRVREWYEYHNGEVYVSFSGGKDSTVLLHIVRSIYPDVEAVFSDTGLEYPEIKQFVKGFDNVTIVRPDMSFKQVVEQKGYPIVSKSVSNCVRLAKQNIADGKDTLRVRQIRGLEVGSNFNKGKWASNIAGINKIYFSWSEFSSIRYIVMPLSNIQVNIKTILFLR